MPDPEFEPIVQARFQVTLDDGSPNGFPFVDALNIPLSEWGAVTEKDIAVLRQQRVDGYLAAVEAGKNAPPLSDAEVKAELQARKAALVEQLASVDGELAAVDVQVKK